MGHFCAESDEDEISGGLKEKIKQGGFERLNSMAKCDICNVVVLAAPDIQ